MGLLAPAFLAGLLAVSIPVLIHMIHRERRETLAFPSLMFLRKIPYRSVRRQKLRHLLLLALRCVAVIIIVGAFARPFIEKQLVAPTPVSDGREVVLIVDQSYSMAHGARWARAINAARRIAGGIRSVDRLSIIAFSGSATQVLEPTSAQPRISSAIDALRPGSEPTRYASGFRLAAQILGASERARKEIVLISDFHRAGWAPNDDVTLPPRTSVRAVDVSRNEKADVAISHVGIARSRRGADRLVATVTARAVNLGDDARTVEAELELAGRRVATRGVSVPPRGSAQVVFAAAPVSSGATRGAVRIASPVDSQPSNDAFFFTVAEESGASALIVTPARPRANQSLYLSRALSVADDPPVEVDVRDIESLTGADLRARSLIVLNEVDLPGGSVGAQLRARLEDGALVLLAPGERGLQEVDAASPWAAVLPARAGDIVSRGDGGRWTSVDFSNPLFEPFRGSGNVGFSAVTAMRYRALTPVPGAQVIARLDDGAPLLVERSVGTAGRAGAAGVSAGRVLMWGLSLDANWTDLPFHPLFVPFVHQLARRSLAGQETRSWFLAPHALDLSSSPAAVVESPSGDILRVEQGTRPALLLRERGFYEIRGARTAIGAGTPVAVNVDIAESDLSHFDPAELIAAVTSGRSTRSGGAAAGEQAPAFTGTDEELERRQAVWWYLLLGALLLLAAETLFSNRLSKRGLDQLAVERGA